MTDNRATTVQDPLAEASPEPQGEIFSVVNICAIAFTVVLLGAVLEDFAEIRPSLLIALYAAAPMLVAAVVVAVRRRRWLALLAPALLMAGWIWTFVKSV